MICDIEGYEYELLDPAKTPALRQCDILVELHEFERAGLTMEGGRDELMRRFSVSHDIEIVSAQPRYVPDLQPAVIERLGSRCVRAALPHFSAL